MHGTAMAADGRRAARGRRCEPWGSSAYGSCFAWALLIWLPQACRGETTVIRRAPPDLLPTVIVYGSADNLALGSACML